MIILLFTPPTPSKHQEWLECMVRIGAALYRKETNNGSVARALSRFMADVGKR